MGWIRLALILGVSTIVKTKASPVAPFTLPLPQLFGEVANTPVTPSAFDSLPETDTALRHCAHLAPTSQPAPSASVLGPCDSAKYLASLRDLASATVAKASGSGGGRLVPHLPTVDSDASFAQVFAEYVEPRKAVQLQLAEYPSQADNEAKETLTACANIAPPTALASLAGASLQTHCPAALTTLRVPITASNDYLVRLTGAALLATTDLASTTAEDRHSPFTQPPTLLSLGGDDSSSSSSSYSELGHACGLGMHAAFQVVAGSVQAVLVDTQAPTHFGKDTGKEVVAPHFGTDAASLHHFQYSPPLNVGTTREWLASPTAPPPHAVSTGSTLLVPHSTLVALKKADTGPALVLKYCYVDASNLNLVKSHVQLEAHVNPTARPLASALSSLRLDTAMDRQPKALPWSAHSQWPRPPEEASSDSTVESTAGGKQGKRVRRTQKDWQADVKWKWRVVGLTLPTLSPPTVKSFGRRNATLNWLSGFQMQEGDSSEFGYNVTWYLGHASEGSVAGFKQVAHTDTEGLTKSDALDDYHAHDLTFALPDGSLAPATEYTFRVAIYYGEVSAPSSGSSRPLVTPALSAPTRTNAPPQPSSPAAEVDLEGSAEVVSTTSVALWSLPPIDDGGSPVVGYVIETRHSERGMHTEWVVVGSHPAPEGGGPVHFTVEHLIPNTGYEFRLTPYNHVGVAKTAGTPSAAVFTGSKTKHHQQAALADTAATKHHVLGHGSKVVTCHHLTLSGQGTHENAASVAQGLEAMHDPHVFTVHGPVVTLSDVTQTVTPQASRGVAVGEGLAAAAPTAPAMEVWVSHWSPKSWHATAEVIVADPPLADTPLVNAKAVRQRIVMIERGGVPMVQKVLTAQGCGALGVILTDTGECSQFDQHCSPGADKKNGDGFAKLDTPGPWSLVRIPVVMMLRDDADTLLSLFE
eukprot:CAMPEP_0171760464 /NCGR_PEP_ID=MMETSP0991-20121206/47483_1 /TAXON_ID=483369 /ORGANISM="non described non described, Strain CCMP2098" /LENGTH=923 /DNA_ID=CAMNT_0012363555 /DNA_START=121 /DNA_END=2893 /DNA_ORIENTATION=+